MNGLGLAAPNGIRCQRTAVARPCRGSLRLRGLVVDSALHRLEPLDCKGCGQRFKPRNHRARFCSMSCSRATPRVATPDRICENCGKTYSYTGATAPSVFNRRRLCTKNCRDVTQPDIVGRDRARKMYPLEPCEVCGLTGGGRGGIERHHRDRNRMNNERENIAFLCPPHHRAAHVIQRNPVDGRFLRGYR